jgi:23S rRNA (adenine2503-C2)-methyltransferase
MKFSGSLFLLLSALPPISLAFSPTSNKIGRVTSMASTVAPEPPISKEDKDGKDKSGLPIQITTKKIIEISQERKPSTTEEQPKQQQVGPISMTFDELSEALGGVGRARIVWDCYKLGIDPSHMFGSVINLGQDDYETIVSKLPSQRRNQKLSVGTIGKLGQLYQDSYGGQTNPGVTNVEGGVATLSFISRSSDQTTKLLLKLSDGLEVETVIIPWKGKRSTLCISSQVGCRQGCTFCATGKMGKLRNLTSDEILAQMFYAQKLCRLEDLPAISNVVFMGMGEPSDNMTNVVRAATALTTRSFFSLSAHRVTISTVAPTPECFTELAKAPCVMAWSVHAVRDDLRKRLVPTTKYSMVELRQGLIDALLTRPVNSRICMLEVALMRGVNDQIEHADDIVEFIQGMVDQVPGVKPHVNLIPFNDIGQSLYEKPLAEDVSAFQNHLKSKGVYVHVRTTRGDEKTSACGQLATTKPKGLSVKQTP